MGISLQPPSSGSPWQTALRVAVLFLAEAGLIALIKDAAISVLIATVVCALIVLGLLEGEPKLRRLHRSAFTVTILLVSAIYLYFVGYAIVHAMERDRANQELVRIYTSMSPYFRTAGELNNATVKDAKYSAAVAQYQQDFEDWQKKTADWLEENLSPAAKQQFFDVSNIQFRCWGPPGQCRDMQVSGTLEEFNNAKRNLQIIMQNRGVTF